MVNITTPTVRWREARNPQRTRGCHALNTLKSGDYPKANPGRFPDLRKQPHEWPAPWHNKITARHPGCHEPERRPEQAKKTLRHGKITARPQGEIGVMRAPGSRPEQEPAVQIPAGARQGSWQRLYWAGGPVFLDRALTESRLAPDSPKTDRAWPQAKSGKIPEFM